VGTILFILVLAFISCGIAQVFIDLKAPPIDRPLWALRRPTLGGAFLAALTWFIRLSVVPSPSVTLGRARAYSLLISLTRLCCAAIFFWGVINLTGNYIESPVVQVIAVGSIFIFGAPIILPVLNIIITPILFILFFPIDFIFPLRTTGEVKQIAWCKTCRHYKKSKKWGGITEIWRSGEMPDERMLPCKIASETLGTWIRYFESDPSHRRLYPNDCEYFERK